MLEISNAMVGLYKEAFGRGPTKARAQFAGPDTLVVILEASLTVAERNLVAMGEHQRLREARLFFNTRSRISSAGSSSKRSAAARWRS